MEHHDITAANSSVLIVFEFETTAQRNAILLRADEVFEPLVYSATKFGNTKLSSEMYSTSDCHSVTRYDRLLEDSLTNSTSSPWSNDRALCVVLKPILPERLVDMVDRYGRKFKPTLDGIVTYVSGELLLISISNYDVKNSNLTCQV